MTLTTAGTGRAQSRLVAPLGLFVIAIVVLEAAFGEVGFGTAGEPLLVLMCAAGYAGTGWLFLTRDRAPGWVAMVLLAGMTVCVLGLHAADPQGPVIGLFLIAAFAPLREPRRAAGIIVVLGVLGFNAVQMWVAQEDLLLTVATDAGAAFFFLFGTIVRSEREQREAVHGLLRELEQSRAAERTATVLAERARLAREVHDVLAHSLSGLALQLEGARLLAAQSEVDPLLADTVDRAHRLARTGLEEARRAVGTLRGDVLPGPEGVADLLAEHRLSGGTVRLTERGHPVPLPAESGLAVYRTVQEALSNVRKHAPAAPVDLVLRWEAQRVVLTVSNPVPDRVPVEDTGGSGLTGMAERAALAGADLSVVPGPGRFEVRLAVPYAETAITVEI